MTTAEYDFRKPPPGALERHVTAWLAAACRRAADGWAAELPYPAGVQLVRVESLSASACLRALPEGAVGVPLAPADSPDGGALLVLPNPLLLALLAGLMGEVPAALPAERGPTDLEASLVPHLIGALFAKPLAKNWPGADPPAFAAGAPVEPAAAWGGGERTLFATLTVTTPFGDQPAFLLLTRTGRWEHLARSNAPLAVVPPAPREQIESLVRAMAVEMSVVLGTADVSMNDPAGLTAGDVVVFDQKVSQPLDGLVAGARKFRVWPGVVGDRAAVVVDAVTPD